MTTNEEVIEILNGVEDGTVAKDEARRRLIVLGVHAGDADEMIGIALGGDDVIEEK